MEGLIKELSPDERQMFACQATDVIRSRFIEVEVPSFVDEVLDKPVGKHVLSLQGSETEGPVGMAYVKVFSNGAVNVHVVLDRSRPERLLAEIGELGIEMYYKMDSKSVNVRCWDNEFTMIEVSNIVPTRAELRSIGADTKVDGDNRVRRLKPVEWVWDF